MNVGREVPPATVRGFKVPGTTQLSGGRLCDQRYMEFGPLCGWPEAAIKSLYTVKEVALLRVFFDRFPEG